MNNTTTKRKAMKFLLASILIIMLAVTAGLVLSQRGTSVEAFAYSQTTTEFSNSTRPARSEEVFETFTLQVPERAVGDSMLNSDTNSNSSLFGFYEYMRIHKEDGTVFTYDVSDEYYESLAFGEEFEYQGVQPLNTYTATILRAGAGANNSIVVVIMGEGFTAGQQNLFLDRARAVTNTMLDMHPFWEFSHLFRVYALQTISAEAGISRDHATEPGNGSNRNTYFNSRFNRSGTSHTLHVPLGRRNRARDLARAVNSNVAMKQVIANTQHNTHGGTAWMGSYTHGLSVRFSVTSAREVTTTQWNRAWHGIFIHEFGHSFGQLIDEHDNANTRRETAANATRRGDGATVKWSHLRGHGRVLNTPRSIGNNWFVPASGVSGSACIMRGSGWSNQFSAVAASELSRRMAAVAGVTFRGKNLNSINGSVPSTPANFTIPTNETYVFPYAFHGNTSLQSITLHSGVSFIDRYAFIGARNLRTVIMHHTTTWQIPSLDENPFAGLNKGNIQVLIPIGATQAFISAGWGDFVLVENVGFTTSGSGASITITGTTTNPVGHLTIPSKIRGNDGNIGTVTAIGAGAFQNRAQLSHISLPSSITSIGINAFRHTTQLVSFTGNRANIHMHVPPGTIQQYRSRGWTGFPITDDGWVQPTWVNGATNSHGTISASGHNAGRAPWGAYDGWLGEVEPAIQNGFPAAQWTKNATAGWLRMELNRYIVVHQIVFYNNSSLASHRTRDAKFTGSGGVALGAPFTAVNATAGRTVIDVGGVRTRVIALSILSSFNGHIGANEIFIHATHTSNQSNIFHFTQIDAGFMHSMGIDNSGRLLAWGNNGDGRLGDGTTTNRVRPVVVAPGTRFSSVSAGGSHGAAIDISGGLWAWGLNTYGRLGDGTTTRRLSPVRIRPDLRFVRVSAGLFHNLAIDTQGRLFAWGRNNSGQLGRGNTTNSSVPVQIMSGTTFTDISAGREHSMAIDSSGRLWAWGLGTHGRIGDGAATSRTAPVMVLPNTTFVSVSAGHYHSMALDNTGQLFAWGRGNVGQLGQGNTLESRVPLRVALGRVFTSIEAGAAHSLAIDSDAGLWGWGANTHGTIGNGNTTNQPSPIFVKQNVLAISAGGISGNGAHTLSITADNLAWGWGNRAQGRLGDGLTTPDRLTPILVRE